MDRKLVTVLLAVFISGSSYALTDSLWTVGGTGQPGGLVTVEVWLQYEGGGEADEMSAFDVLLTYDATICEVEAITVGPDFSAWTDQSRIDNASTPGPKKVARISVSAFTFGPPIGPPFVERGVHLAGTVDFRIVDTAEFGNSARIDTLWQAFSPPIYLGFVDRGGANTYMPAYSGGSIVVQDVVEDVAPISITSPPDTVYLDSIYVPSATIRNLAADSAGPILVVCNIDSWADSVEIPVITGLDSTTVNFADWAVSDTGVCSVTIFTQYSADTNGVNDIATKSIYATSGKKGIR